MTTATEQLASLVAAVEAARGPCPNGHSPTYFEEAGECYTCNGTGTVLRYPRLHEALTVACPHVGEGYAIPVPLPLEASEEQREAMLRGLLEDAVEAQGWDFVYTDRDSYTYTTRIYADYTQRPIARAINSSQLAALAAAVQQAVEAEG